MLWAATLGVMVARAAELPSGFIEEKICEGLNAATAMTVAPDGRVFICEQTGTLRVVKDDKLLSSPALTLKVDDYWERGLIGATLDPSFPVKPYIYVMYISPEPYPHHVVSRFTITGDTVSSASEKILLEGDDQRKIGGNVPAGHQGGPLRFGADGKLYIGIGEHTAGKPSQDLNTLQGKLLRINPDGTIPDDNPFYTKTTGKYRAIWAYGLRNPFGLAVQPGTGRMFFTDVGASAWEEVNEAVAGANYGWPLAEGYSTNAEFKSPLYAYPPVVGRSICGAAFYNPPKPQFPTRFVGKFFFLDYMAHWMKAMDPDNPKSMSTFAKGFNGPVAVEVAPDGSLYVLTRGAWVRDKKFTPNSGALVRIRYAGETYFTKTDKAPSLKRTVAVGLPADARDLPKVLSRANVFQSLNDAQPTDEWVGYEMNSPPWQPGVNVRRWMALPRGAKMTVSETGELTIPTGSAFLWQFDLASERSAAPVKHLETRLVVFGQPYGYGVAYRWRDDGSDADLVDDGELIEVKTSTAKGKSRYWFFPGIEEHLSFPSLMEAYALRMNAAQLNCLVRNITIGTQENQLAIWNGLGLFNPPLSSGMISRLPKMARLEDPNAPVEVRVRSYLDANCAICHQPGGASRGLFDARFATPLAQTGLINGPLAAGDLGFAGAQVIAPGNPDKSIIYQRLKRNDFFRMPPVTYHTEAPPVLPLLAEWIKALK